MHQVEGNNRYIGWSPVGQAMQVPGYERGFQPVEPPIEEPPEPGEDVEPPRPGDYPAPPGPGETSPELPYTAPTNGGQIIAFAKKNPVLTIGAALLLARLFRLI